MKITSLICGVILAITTNAQSFFNPLNIPPSLSGTNFTLTVDTSSRIFYGSVSTPTYGINGTYLGPTLFFNRGDSVTINVINNLSESTTMHWHGMHVPSRMDGGPHTVIAANSNWQVGYRIMNAASTCWYHPHLDMNTGDQVYKGMAGVIIVQDTIEGQLNLPRTYGTDDFPIVLQDRSYNTNGTFLIEGLADSMLVNGTANAYLDCPAQVVRLRVLNGSNVRAYNIGFNDNRNFYVIASDGGMLDQPFMTNRLKITGGERYEILLDLSTSLGNSFTMKSFASSFTSTEPGGGGMQNGSGPLNGVDFNIMQINVVAATSNPVTAIPGSLITLNPWLSSNANLTRYKTIDGMGMFTNMNSFTFNNTAFDMMEINDTIPLNNIEIWEFTNNSNLAHPIHIHDVPFYILTRNGIAPPAYEVGLKDVFYIRPNEVVQIITKFEDFKDDSVPYMYHCHNLMHEDNGMMAQFIVVDPSVGIRNISKTGSGFDLYPNPADELFTIRFSPENGSAAHQFEVYNALGELIFTDSVTGGEITVHSINWPNGIYTVRISDQVKSEISRVIIAR